MGQYVVVGGAAMAVHGIRESHDINIAVLPALFSQLREAGNWQMTEIGGRVHLMFGAYEILSDVRIRGYESTIPDLIRTAEIVDGVPFVDLVELRNFKHARGTQKDLVDIKLINDYLLHHSK